MNIKYKGKVIASIYSVISIKNAELLVKNQIGEEFDSSLIELEPETDKERVGLIRRDISVSGDTDSILGTTSDNANLVLVEFSKLILALDSVSSIEDVKQAAASFKQNAEDLLNKLDSKEYSFPYLKKGLDNVLLEVGQRATAVNNVLFNNTAF